MEQNAESLLNCVVEYGQPAAKQHISVNTWTFVLFLYHVVAFYDATFLPKPINKLVNIYI